MSTLREDLASHDAEIRRQAVHALASENPEDRAKLLVHALGDSDWRVRKEAARVAGDVGESWGLLPDLVDAVCQGENVGLRNAALEVLERLGPGAADAILIALPRVALTSRKFLVQALGFAGGAGVERIAKLADDEDPNTAQAALEALARIGGQRPIEVLRGHVCAADPVKRLVALEGLERLEAAVPVVLVRELFADRLMRRVVVRVLGHSADPHAVSLLLEGVADRSVPIARESIRSLGRILMRGGECADAVGASAPFSSEVRDVLRRVGLLEADSETRRDAVWLLLLARDPECVGALADLLADDRLPPAAIEALRRWGEGAIEPFLAVATEGDSRARAAAIQVAAELGRTQISEGELGPRIRAVLREALEVSDDVIVVAAAEVIGPWADGSDAPRLVKVARDVVAAQTAVGAALEELARRDRRAVESATRDVSLDGTLGAALMPVVAVLGGPDAADRLNEALNAADPAARRAAVLALPRLGGAPAAELAGFALADEDLGVQAAAVTVLGELNAAAPGELLGVEQLRLALRGPEPIAGAAARVLGRIGDRRSIVPLRELASEGRPGVAVAALEALRTLDDNVLGGLAVEALGSDDVEVVKEALRSIASSDAPRRASRLGLALSHRAWDVRQLAAELLGALDDPDAHEALRQRAQVEDDPGVLEVIREALVAHEGDD